VGDVEGDGPSLPQELTMNSRTRSFLTASAWVAAGALGATALTGVALAAGHGPTTATSPAASTTTSPQHPGLMGSTLHGTLTVATDDGTQVVDVQRGEVTAVSATSITLTSSDGFTATYTTDSDTRVRHDGAAATLADVAVGDTAFVRSTAGTADVVRDWSPEGLAAMQKRLSSGAGMRGGRLGGGGGMMGNGGGMMRGAGMMADADDV